MSENIKPEAPEDDVIAGADGFQRASSDAPPEDTVEQMSSAGAEAVERAHKALQDALDALMGKTPPKDDLGHRVDTSREWLMAKVRERPITAVIASLCIGLILGLMFRGPGRQR